MVLRFAPNLHSEVTQAVTKVGYAAVWSRLTLGVGMGLWVSLGGRGSRFWFVGVWGYVQEGKGRSLEGGLVVCRV